MFSPTTAHGSDSDSPIKTRKLEALEASQRILETVFRFYCGSAQQLVDSKLMINSHLGSERFEGQSDEADSVDNDLDDSDLNLLQQDLGGLGLVEMAKIYNVDGIRLPKRKIWILLLGNHSAGKSSFINWYVDYPVQKTSVAIETTSFTFVTGGNKRETFGGPATCQLFPVLKKVSELKGVLPCLATEIVPSSSKNFDMITFIDSPGLVDGGLKYPYDPEEVLIELAKESDLVFSFFDPVGQALCARTMNVVEAICKTQGHKIFFYLSKADTIPDESDRQKVLIQIAQSLTHRIQDRQFSLDIPPIYIPHSGSDVVPVRNHMQGLMASIDATIAQGVQKSLASLKSDCTRIAYSIRQKISQDDSAIKFNNRDFGRGFLLISMGVGPILGIFLIIAFRIVDTIAEATGEDVLGFGGKLMRNVLRPYDSLVRSMDWKSIGYTFAASIVSLVVWWLLVKKRKTLSPVERTTMLHHLD
ncbi:hypothetical protein HDU83_007904, partial [Entophlyctis luteolus]